MKIHGKYTLDEDKNVVCTCGEKICFGWSHISIFLIKP